MRKDRPDWVKGSEHDTLHYLASQRDDRHYIWYLVSMDAAKRLRTGLPDMVTPTTSTARRRMKELMTQPVINMIRDAVNDG